MIQVHIDKHPGLVMEGITVKEHPNHGKPCFVATSKIGSLFGCEVDGEIKGIGRTEAEAIERLGKEREKLYESLW